MRCDASWPSDPNTYVSSFQVAARLGYGSVKTFQNALNTELRDRKFPARARGRLWRASQIEQWETWNAHRASLNQATNDNDTPPSPAAPAQHSPARQRLAQQRAAAGLDR